MISVYFIGVYTLKSAKIAAKRSANATATARSVGAVALLGALSAVGVAQAQNAAPTSADQSLTWNGITLFGTVDIGLQYDTHGAPFSDYHPAGSYNLVSTSSRQSVVGATPSNLAQSKIGLQGVEPVIGDWNAVFKLETFFNPQSGQISDALRGITQNNGRAPLARSTSLDSSVAGQAFQTAYVGMSSKTFGTVTFGRQLTLVGDGVNKYDPNYASQAFSVIGMSGTYAGAGATEDKRVDSSIKYVASFNDMLHVGAMYKFNGSNGGANSGAQVDLGGEFGGLSVDAYYSKFKSAIAVSPLSAAQVALLPALGFSSEKSLKGTVSDNTTFAVMGLYNLGAPKLFFGYEHIKYANPSTPLGVGFDDIGGYKLAVVDNAAFTKEKILNVYWAGVRYTAIAGLDLTAAFYGYHQNSFAQGALAGCSTTVSGACSGTLQAVSLDADYIVTKRFDVYAGAMYSRVQDGAANGYTVNNNLNPTVGVRYKF